MLNKNTVVSTIMSNTALVQSLEKLGIKSVQTTVGDRFVYESMQQNDYSLGGEESGHIILKKYATTGDGLLSAIMLTEEICDTKMPLSKLHEDMQLYPQHLLNIKVQDKKAVLNDAMVKLAVKEVEEIIGKNGKVLLRASGTEPVVRIMIEYSDINLCKEYAEKIKSVMVERGYVNA